jgi:hypothetical protein
LLEAKFTHRPPSTGVCASHWKREFDRIVSGVAYSLTCKFFSFKRSGRQAKGGHDLIEQLFVDRPWLARTYGSHVSADQAAIAVICSQCSSAAFRRLVYT